ncbi:MAG: hypothetical protein OEZ32_11245 [Nitrospinota bacterium]|nr:hypothetical protein [Nitrospinota bacterium]
MSHKPYPAYKPSGVEWLGQIPEHWEPRKRKRSEMEIANLLKEVSG